MFKNILIPTDGSTLSDSAVTNGVALAKTLNARIVGVHVIPSQLGVIYAEMAWIDDATQIRLREYSWTEGNRHLDRIQAAAQAAGVKSERVLKENDLAWKGIVDTAHEKGCDLILMAAHGRRGLAALLLGSETNNVLIHSKIPVLVYR